MRLLYNMQNNGSMHTSYSNIQDSKLPLHGFTSNMNKIRRQHSQQVKEVEHGVYIPLFLKLEE